jgi:tetratricopeptide (TPR) repeat protein
MKIRNMKTQNMKIQNHNQSGMDTGMDNRMTTKAVAGVGWRRRARTMTLACLVTGSFCLAATAPGTAWGQAVDRVNLLGGTSISGKIVSVSPVGVDVENSDGNTQKVAIETIREVQFGAEPQSLKNARSMLLRGRGADARDEVGKIEADELDGADQLVLAEVDFVKAAVAAQAVLDAGGDLAAASKTVADYLAKHPKSHHFFQMQELLGDLHARAGKPTEAVAAYQQLDGGPPALQVRAASAKAAMMLAQGKADEAMAEYDAAIKLAGNEKASQPQKRAAELGKAKCLSLQGKHDAAIAMVLQIIKDSSPEEKELLSRAYNVLGSAYRGMSGREQDALIQFLTVDLVYNTLPDSHAEALFNLGELWDKGSNPERAREARQNLKAAYPASTWAAKLEAPKS